MATKPFSKPLAISTAIALAILLSLGTWQLSRLGWKQDLLARIDALSGSPAQPLAVVLHRIEEGRDVEFTRVQVDCADPTAQTVQLYALHEGRPGWRPVLACRLDSSPATSILVDLGFRPGEAGAAPVDTPVELPPGVALIGVLRKPTPESWYEWLVPRAPSEDGRQWFRRDIVGMAAALGVPDPVPAMLVLETPQIPGLTPAPLPTGLSNRHLEYALTWYGLALALAAVYIALLVRDRKA